MKMPNPDSDRAHQRHVYLLTCWKEQGEDVQTINWRFKLETPGPKRKRTFDSLVEVFETIEKELEREMKG